MPRSLPPRAAYGAKAVGALVPALTKQAFQRFGFSTATLLTEWSRIVGADLARVAIPERVKWPRRREQANDDEAPASREGATIVLRVDGPRAVEVQYRSQQIKDRINAYFGYAAITTVRIMQAPLPERSRSEHRPHPGSAGRAVGHGTRARPDLSEITSPDLREALTRLYAGVAGRAGG